MTSPHVNTNTRVDKNFEVKLTKFEDVFARYKEDKSASLAIIANGIRKTKKERKENLPLLKLATFGDMHSSKGSLRWDNNVLSVTGVELDYDGEKIPFDDARLLLLEADIACIIYTTPSHTEEKPRWRVLAPFSCKLPPAERTRMIARLNGVLHGVAHSESFSLSQSYYYGYVTETPRVDVLDGVPINLRDDLDAGAIGKPGRKSTGNGKYGPALDLETAVEIFTSGGPYHPALAPLIGSLVARGLTGPTLFELMGGLFNTACKARPEISGRQKEYIDVINWVLEQEAKKTAPAPEHQPGSEEPVTRDDFFAIMPQNLYVYTPTLEFWSSTVIDKRLGKKTSTWICKERAVEQVTWAPGEPQIITDRIVLKGGLIHRRGNRIFNLYLAPKPITGNPADIEPWIDHIRRIYPDDETHIIRWCAHAIQRPTIKINHALVLGGNMGIGKDTLIEPVRRAVGHWNFHDVSPQQLLGRFNGFAKSVILRINEARDLGDSDRFKFYDHMKTMLATPPETTEVNEKHLKEYLIPNLINVIITTNHKADGIHLPPDDRRHYVAWTQVTMDEFPPNYWNQLWNWYERQGGFDNVAAYLATFDLTGWDPKAPPPKTRAFFDIADASRAPEDSELADIIDRLENPPALTIEDLVMKAQGATLEWLQDRKNRRSIPHRLEKAGYTPVRNIDRQDGLWLLKWKNEHGSWETERKTIYALTALSIAEQITAAKERIARMFGQ